MESQRPVPPGPDPGLCGCDRDIFLRVWSRVMPEEREDCPIEVTREPAVPAMVQRTADRDQAADDFPTGDDVPCLGSGALADRERLQEFTIQELAHWRSYQMLSRRAGQGARMLSAMAAGCRRRAKRLSAALFLISGVRFWPTEQAPGPIPRSYFGALREHFLSEQNRGGAYRAAAEECRDHCLQMLYLDLAEECAEHACRIRALLENL